MKLLPISSLLYLCLIFITSCSPAPMKSQKTETDESKAAAFQKYPDALYPIRKKDKWGYMNRRGDLIIPFQYDAAEDFIDGIAKAGLIEGSNSLYGFIDRNGQWLIRPSYQRAGIFSEGLCAVQKDDMYGFINSSGEVIIPFQFEDAGNFHEGLAAVKINGWTGFINQTGNVEIEPKYICSVSHPVFVGGMAPVFGADEKTGYINKEGEWVIDNKFHSASSFKDGIAWAMMEEQDDHAEHGFTIKGGYIDTTGNYIIHPEYDFGWDFSEGYATVWKRSDDKTEKIWKVIDTQGRVILDHLPYRNVGSMSNGLIPIQNEKMDWGFMNIKGEVIIQPQFAGINHFKNGLARMETGNAFDPEPVYINETGMIVWQE